MTTDQMKSRLDEMLTMWKKVLDKERNENDEYTTYQARVSGMITGMIDFSYEAQIISDDEKKKLESLYLGLNE